MTRTFIEVPLFTKRWKEIGLDDNDLHSLQIMLLKDPESGPVMEGTGGIRKVRFPLENKGKSGSVRVCYTCLLYTSPSPRDAHESRMPSSA